MAIDFDKWNKIFNITEEEVQELEENADKKERVELPYGNYEVAVSKMHISASKKGDPMFVCRFRILNGIHKNSVLYMNQVITQNFQVHIVNEFLKSLDSGLQVRWTGDYREYGELVEAVFEEVRNSLEYALSYTSSEKGFPVYRIMKVFDKE